MPPAPAFATGLWSLDSEAPAKPAETARSYTQSQAGIAIAGVNARCALDAVVIKSLQFPILLSALHMIKCT